MNIPIELLKVLKSVDRVKENNVVSKYFFLNNNAFYFSDNNFAIKFVPIYYDDSPFIVFNYDALMDAIKGVNLNKVIDADLFENSFTLLTKTKKPIICKNIIAKETNEVEYKDKVINNIMSLFCKRKERKNISSISYAKRKAEIYHRIFSVVKRDLVIMTFSFMEENVFIQDFFCALYTVKIGRRLEVCKGGILV